MQSRSRPKPRHLVPLAVPRLAVVHEDRVLEVGVHVAAEVGHSRALGHHRLDVFLLLLADAFHDVIAYRLDHHRQRTRADRGVGSQHDVEVGESVRCKRHVCFRSVFPVFAQPSAINSRDGEGWRSSRVEAGSTYNHVEFVQLAVGCDDAVRLNLRDMVAHEIDIVLDERFQKSRSRSQASTSGRKVGLEPLEILRLLCKSLFHARLELLQSVFLHFRSLDSKRMDLVAAGLDLRPELFEILWVVSEPRLLFFGENDRFHAQLLLDCLAKGRRYPCLAPDETGEVCSRDLLQLWDDLDRRAAGSNDTHALVREVVAGLSSVLLPSGNSNCNLLVVPLGRVHYLSLETTKAIYLRPGNVIQPTSCADEHIGSVIDHSPVRSLHRDVPFAFALAEVAARDLMS
jgi:hypothetical protein